MSGLGAGDGGDGSVPLGHGVVGAWAAVSATFAKGSAARSEDFWRKARRVEFI